MVHFLAVQRHVASCFRQRPKVFIPSLFHHRWLAWWWPANRADGYGRRFMRWEGREESENVEDRRGMPVGGMIVGGGLGTLVIIFLAMLLGMNPRQLMEQPGFQAGNAPKQQMDPARQKAEEPIRKFVGVVFRDTEDVWAKIFREQLGRSYQKPKLVVFTDRVQSACGMANAAVGPFYCPGDANVYLDFSFFAELKQKFKAEGDFAMAYVVAHEVAHHVQNLLGLSNQVSAMQQRVGMGSPRANQLSVRLELQADYLAGVWAHHLQKDKRVLEEGDLEEALNAAAQIGDNKIQQKMQGYVVPDAFTHGTDRQRLRWLREGMISGDINRMMELFELDYDKL
jgi:predicted metalloprotease